MRVRHRALLACTVLCVAAVAALSASAAGTIDVSNNSGVDIPDVSLASPYPSTIDVSGVPGNVSKVTVTLHDLTHTCPSDLNIMLEAPNGSTVWLAAQSGACDGAFDGDVTFDDSAGANWDFSSVAGGTYRPTQDGSSFGVGNCTWNTSLPGGAPSGPYGTSLSSLNGSSANGTWKLYIQDNCLIDQGTISGWTLHLTTGGTTRAEDNIFLCYSKFQVDPGVWRMSIAKSLLKEGDYWLPYAVAGNPLGSHTILGNY